MVVRSPVLLTRHGDACRSAWRRVGQTTVAWTRAAWRAGARGRFLGQRCLLAAAIAVSAIVVGIPGAALAEPMAAKVQGDQTAGYGRMIFKFPDMPNASTRVSNGI